MEFYSEKHVTARKAHICEMCKETIPVGTPYWRESGKFNGDFFSRSLHDHCHGMEAEYCTEVDTEFSWDEIIDYIAEKHCQNCEHSYLHEDKEGWTECPYMDVTECRKLRKLYQCKEIE